MSVVTLTAHVQREVWALIRHRQDLQHSTRHTGLALSLLLILPQHSGRTGALLVAKHDVGQPQADIAPPHPAVILQASAPSQ